jgi:hypothetical protein
MKRSIKQLVCGALAFVVLAFSGSVATAGDYDGPDGGHLIFSVGTLHIPMNFLFRYRSVAPVAGSNRVWNGVIECRCVGFFTARMANPDYSGRETGKVMMHRLPPGDYEIYDFGFGGAVGNSITTFSSGQRFVIPFTIRPGGATYVGSFTRAPSLGTSLEASLDAKGYFVISDRHERDLAIARARTPDLVEPTVSVTDVSVFNHPALRTSEP